MDNNQGQGSVFLPEEIMADILLRLPIKTLFRVKCASKELNSFISNKEFGHSYMTRANSPPDSSSRWRLWGFLPPFSKRYEDEQQRRPKPSVYDELSDVAPPSLYAPVIDNSYKADILASSNGLVLSLYPLAWESSQVGYVQKLSVSNPLTKQHVELPSLSGSFSRKSFGFVARVGGDDGHASYVTYKVVCIRMKWPSRRFRAAITTFSSDTGRWSDEKKVQGCPELVFQSSPLVCNGILHWFDWYKTRSVVTYDPYNSPEGFGWIQLPGVVESELVLEDSGMDLIQLGHEDVLRYGDVEECGDNDRWLCVWRLVDYDSEEWCLEKRCRISPVWPDWFLEEWEWKLVAPDPWNGESFCTLCVDDDMFMAQDIGSAKAVFVERGEYRAKVKPYASTSSAYVPIALCPWSSPYYGEDKWSSSSTVGFRKISPVWFPSFSN